MPLGDGFAKGWGAVGGTGSGPAGSGGQGHERRHRGSEKTESRSMASTTTRHGLHPSQWRHSPCSSTWPEAEDERQLAVQARFDDALTVGGNQIH
jgi:hypothetical protein